MCKQNHQCSTEILLNLKTTTEASLTMPEFHIPVPPGCDQLPCPRVCLQRLFEERTLAIQVLFQQEKIDPLLQWDSQSKCDLISMKWKGRRLTSWVHIEEPPCDKILLDDVCALHTNEAYTTVCISCFLLSTRECPHSESIQHWGKLICSTTASLWTPLSQWDYQTGRPTGLNVSYTRLTAYNGTQ